MLQNLANVAYRRLLAAYLTPAPAIDARTGLAVAAFAATALALGARSGVLQAKVERRPLKWLEVFVVVFLTRGLLEELAFRVVALPHPAVDGPTAPGDFAAAASTAVFVSAHLLLPGQRARQTYRSGGFLGMCAAFGALCSYVYYSTASLQAVWLAHCVPVAVWLLLLGGAEKVQ